MYVCMYVCVCVCVYVSSMQKPCVILCYHLWSPGFSHYLIKSTIFEKKDVPAHKMYVLIFSKKIVPFILRIIQRDTIINAHSICVKYPIFCEILMTLGYSQQIFEISSNIKFYENPSSCSMQGKKSTDGHEASNHFSQF
jgi:hypothetical protein